MLKRMMKMLPLLVMDTEAISVDQNFDDKVRAKATGLYNIMKDRNFVSTVFFMKDILSVLSFYSRMFQLSAGVLIGKERDLNGLLESIIALKTKNGAAATELLDKALCRKTEHTTAFTPCKTFEAFETAFALNGLTLFWKLQLERLLGLLDRKCSLR